MKLSDLSQKFVNLYNLTKIAEDNGNVYIWKHALRPISFTLCIDNFGMKYVGQEYAKHLLQVLNMH
jgi:hypothetical protein